MRITLISLGQSQARVAVRRWRSIHPSGLTVVLMAYNGSASLQGCRFRDGHMVKADIRRKPGALANMADLATPPSVVSIDQSVTFADLAAEMAKTDN